MSQKNIPHSIFQRLLNLAKSNKVDFNLLLSLAALLQTLIFFEWTYIYRA